MSEACSCHHHRATPPASAAPTADSIVSELARDPAARGILEEFGINHCCGGHLPLSQAAAAAGAPLETLLARLAAARTVPA
jgi:iron-sulfur cluster repair protein YtfE (RIC family)